MWPAFPTSDYYEGSVPSQGHQPTAGLPAAGLAGRRGGRPQDGSHVHHRPIDGVGAQLFPCSLATSTPQTFPVASSPATQPAPESPAHARTACTAARPISARLEPVLSLEGVQPLVPASYTFPSCLPGPGRLAVPARPVVVGAAPTLPCASRVRLPPASPGCCDSPEVGLSSHPVIWRLVAHEGVEKSSHEPHQHGRDGAETPASSPPASRSSRIAGRAGYGPGRRSSCWSPSPSPSEVGPSFSDHDRSPRSTAGCGRGHDGPRRGSGEKGGRLVTCAWGGAGEGNRTLTASLGSSSSTIELRPQEG